MSDPTRADTFATPVRIVSASSGSPPTAALASAIVTGGTLVVVASGPINGGYIVNPASKEAQGIGAAENLYVDPVGDPGSTDAAGNGTTTVLAPGQPYSIPALPAGSSLKANAATDGHKFNAVIFP